VGVNEQDWPEAFAALSAEQIAYLRHVLDVHRNDPQTGECRVCHRPSCPDWRDTYDRLAVGGQLMAEPGRWLPAEDQGGAR
jgi:hypothetical protein